MTGVSGFSILFCNVASTEFVRVTMLTADETLMLPQLDVACCLITRCQQGRLEAMTCTLTENNGGVLLQNQSVLATTAWLRAA